MVRRGAWSRVGPGAAPRQARPAVWSVLPLVLRCDERVGAPVTTDPQARQGTGAVAHETGGGVHEAPIGHGPSQHDALLLREAATLAEQALLVPDTEADDSHEAEVGAESKNRCGDDDDGVGGGHRGPPNVLTCGVPYRRPHPGGLPDPVDKIGRASCR